MKNGFRTPPKKDLQRQLSTEVENTSMAVRITQMMVQQLLENNKSMQADLNQAIGQLTELQYKVLAIQDVLNIDLKLLADRVNTRRLNDFDEAATRQDSKENLLIADVVAADSTVVITSTAKDESNSDAGIFRSRLKLAECGVPTLIEGLQGKTVGTKVSVQLNGIDHEVELLAIRTPAQTTQESQQ
jgi:hypothetical protein